MLHPQPVYIFIDDAKPHQKTVDLAVVCIEQQIEDKSHHCAGHNGWRKNNGLAHGVDACAFTEQKCQHERDGQRKNEFAPHIDEGVYHRIPKHRVPRKNTHKIVHSNKLRLAVAAIVEQHIPQRPQDGIHREHCEHDDVRQQHQIRGALVIDALPDLFPFLRHAVTPLAVIGTSIIPPAQVCEGGKSSEDMSKIQRISSLSRQGGSLIFTGRHMVEFFKTYGKIS